MHLVVYSAWCCTGSLPEAWGETGSFPALRVLDLGDNSLTGAVPASYFGVGPFKRLLLINIAFNKLSGAIPAALPTCTLCQPKEVSATADINVLTLRELMTFCVWHNASDA